MSTSDSSSWESGSAGSGEVKRVAVIGAGVAGLVGLKTALEAGLEAECFEQRNDVGGIWHQLDPAEQPEEGLDIGARTYKGLFMNSMKTWYSCS